jgi:hypothetical protein
MPDPTEREELIAGLIGAQRPRRSDPGCPSPALEPGWRRGLVPAHHKRSERELPPGPRRSDALELGRRPLLMYPETVENDFGRVTPGEGEPAAGRLRRERCHRARSGRAKPVPDPPGRCGDHSRRYGVIIASEDTPSNVEAVWVDPEAKAREQVEHPIPRPPFPRRVLGRPHKVLLRGVAQALANQGQERVPNPRAQVTGITIRRVVMRHETTRRDVGGELVASEGQERSDEPGDASLGDGSEPDGTAALEHAQQDRLCLIVSLVRGDEVTGLSRLLYCAQPAVASGPRSRFARARTEAQLAKLKRTPIVRRHRGYRPSHGAARRIDLMVRVGDDECKPVGGGLAREQVQEGERVGPTGNRDDRDARFWETSRASEMCAKTSLKRRHID